MRARVLMLVSSLLVAVTPLAHAGAQAEDATVTATAPKVHVREKGAESFIKVADAQRLATGDLVRTGKSGLAQIDYPDGSYTRLDHDTKFVVKKLVDDPGERQTKTTVISGQTFNRVAALTETESFTQTAGDAVAGVLGTTFAVERGDDGGSTFTLVEGELTIRLRGGDDPVRLTAGQRVEIAKGGDAGPVESLTPEELCADAWICANQAEFAAGDAPAPTTVPLSLDASGTAPIDPSGRTRISGSGTGTLGSFTFSSDGTLAFPIPMCPGTSGGTLTTTYSFASGEQLFTSWSTATCQSSSSPLTFTTSGPFTVTGGTGRFAGAAGSGTGTGTTTVSGSSGASNAHLEGTITLQPQG